MHFCISCASQTSMFTTAKSLTITVSPIHWNNDTLVGLCCYNSYCQVNTKSSKLVGIAATVLIQNTPVSVNMLILVSLLVLALRAGSHQTGTIITESVLNVLSLRYSSKPCKPDIHDSLLIVSVQIIESGGPPVAGQSYNLTCNVSDPTNVTSYQWNKEGSSLVSETDKILAFPSLSLSDVGTYSCQVMESTETIGTSSDWTLVLPSELIIYNSYIILTLLPSSCSNRHDNSNEQRK